MHYVWPLKFTQVWQKGLKIKVRKFFGLIPTFVEITGQKTGGRGPFAPPSKIGLKLFSTLKVK